MNLVTYLPIVSPAINQKTLNVNHLLILKRVSLVAFATLGFIVSTNYLPTSWFIKSSLLLAAPLVMGFIDLWLSNRAANINPAQEYLHKKIPSCAATFRIRRNLGAAQSLIAGLKNKSDEERARCLNKVDNLGYTLLSSTSFYLALGKEPPDFAIFKTLVDANPSIRACDFKFFVAIKDTRYLSYLLSSLDKKCAPDKFTSAECVEFWQQLGSKEAAELLTEYGFNVNAVDEKGDTALMRLAKNSTIRTHFNLDFGNYVQCLIDQGADRLQEVFDLTSHPIIKILVGHKLGIDQKAEA